MLLLLVKPLTSDSFVSCASIAQREKLISPQLRGCNSMEETE